jgi:hypothetical protein
MILYYGQSKFVFYISIKDGFLIRRGEQDDPIIETKLFSEEFSIQGDGIIREE